MASIIFRRICVYLIFHNIFDFFFINISLALDFRTFQENMKMSSSLSKILETGVNVFKINYQIIKKKYYEILTLYECVEKLSMIIGCIRYESFLTIFS